MFCTLFGKCLESSLGSSLDSFLKHVVCGCFVTGLRKPSKHILNVFEHCWGAILGQSSEIAGQKKRSHAAWRSFYDLHGRSHAAWRSFSDSQGCSRAARRSFSEPGTTQNVFVRNVLGFGQVGAPNAFVCTVMFWAGSGPKSFCTTSCFGWVGA